MCATVEAASVAAAADGAPSSAPCWAPSSAEAPAATNVEATEEAKDDVVMLDDLAAPFERARAIGVQVLRAAAARAAAPAAPARGGFVWAERQRARLIGAAAAIDVASFALQDRQVAL